MTKNDKEVHISVDGDCPLTVMECPFACHGCEEVVLRRDVESHQIDFAGFHSELLSETLSDLWDKVATLETVVETQAGSLRSHDAALISTTASLQSTTASLLSQSTVMTALTQRLVALESRNVLSRTANITWEIKNGAAKIMPRAYPQPEFSSRVQVPMVGAGLLEFSLQATFTGKKLGVNVYHHSSLRYGCPVSSATITLQSAGARGYPSVQRTMNPYTCHSGDCWGFAEFATDASQYITATDTIVITAVVVLVDSPGVAYSVA